MAALKRVPLSLDGLAVIEPFFKEDERGFFCKPFLREFFWQEGMDGEISEVFFTRSRKSVLRGLHFQAPHPQWKLVTVLEGEIFDVGVDLRKNSPSFGKWQGVMLCEKEKKALYLPEGFAHGFLVRSSYALVAYLCGGDYDAKGDGGILWNDSQIGIRWPLEKGEKPILSQKDRSLPTLAELQKKGGVFHDL